VPFLKGAWRGGKAGWGAGGGRRQAAMRWGEVPNPTNRRRAAGNSPAVALVGGQLAVPRCWHETGQVGSPTCGPGAIVMGDSGGFDSNSNRFKRNSNPFKL
jgi:hypothetical protein